MKRFVAIINKKVEQGRAMNALGHMAIGLAGSYPNQQELALDTYIDNDGDKHQNISDHPFIVLKADNGNQIRTVRNKLKEAGIFFVDFIDTMIEGTFQEQKDRTSNTAEADLDYYGICFFGDKEQIDPITKKFSLWR
jgi:hypothetical protein